MTIYITKTFKYSDLYRFQRTYNSETGKYAVTIYSYVGHKIIDCREADTEEEAFRAAQRIVSGFGKLRAKIKNQPFAQAQLRRIGGS